MPKNTVKSVDIQKSHHGTFFVASRNQPGVSYEVDPKTCKCSCPAGTSGAYCKHMLGVHLHTDAVLFTLPPVSLQQKKIYHFIAFGKAPREGYYSSSVDKEETIATIPTVMENIAGNIYYIFI